MEILYVHVKWPDGLDDMIPESAAQIRADAGDFTIVDPTPAPWRRFKPRVPLGTSGQKATVRVVTESAPRGAPKAEEATE